MSEQLLRPKLENIISGHNINNDDADWLRAALAQPAECGEPFGYFRPEPFGWTDCAKTDDGAIALYEHPAEVEQLKNELRISDDMLKAVADLCQKYERWLEFLHSPNKDSEGFEWGIARVKFDGDKTIALWTNQDHSDLDAAIAAAQAERAKGG